MPGKAKRSIVAALLTTVLTPVPQASANTFVPPIFQTVDDLQKKEQFKRELNDAVPPTASPTESPAPSPSPSAVPTMSPTMTPKPTDQPTASPTESPAPSPSPSRIPTVAPTGSPSPPPSVSLSPPPSVSPSPPPSVTPTTQPSSVPSSLPTSITTSEPSLPPSLTPTAKPSFPPGPSAPPTLVLQNLQERFVSQLQLDKQLSEGIEQDSFTQGVSNYIMDNPPDSGAVSNIQVAIVNQTLFEGSNARGRQRNLAITSVRIEFQVVLSYFGTDPNFNLLALYGSAMQSMDQEFVQSLVITFEGKRSESEGNRDNVFEPLLRSSASVFGSSDGPSSRDGVSGTAKAFSILGAVVAVALAIVASVYALRHYEIERQINNLSSPAKSTGEQTHIHRVETMETMEHGDHQRVEEVPRASSAVFRLGDASYVVDVSNATRVSETPFGQVQHPTHPGAGHYKLEEVRRTREGNKSNPMEPATFRASRVGTTAPPSLPPPPPPPPPQPRMGTNNSNDLQDEAPRGIWLRPAGHSPLDAGKIEQSSNATSQGNHLQRPTIPSKKPCDPPTFATVDIKRTRDVYESVRRSYHACRENVSCFSAFTSISSRMYRHHAIVKTYRVVVLYQM